MTQNTDKIEMLKSTIVQLFQNEGRSKSYIARLLDVNRALLTGYISDWGLEQGNISYLTPSNQKFLNKHKIFIKLGLDQDRNLSDLAKELNVTSKYLANTIVPKDKVLAKALEDKITRTHQKAEIRKQDLKEKSYYNYHIVSLPDERWEEILGYDGYYISDYGRIKSYVKIYDDYKLHKPSPNSINGRLYVGLDNKKLQVSRLVGFAFVDGWEENRNTIEHIDNDVQNNYYKNLAWVSQKDNNQLAYSKGRKPAIAYTRNGKFKKIVVNDKYEFKTIRAFASFIGKSETTAQRYLANEVKENPYKIKLIF